MNYTKQYFDGFLEDQPLSRYEKLKTNRHKTNPGKSRTISRNKARLERLKVHCDWESPNWTSR